MDALWQSIEASELAFQIGATWWFPLLESIHVLGVVVVLGSLLMVDLRLLGVAARTYTIEALSAGVLGWAWLGFLVAVFTGIGMFISRPSHYAANPAFQTKLVLLLLIGLNLVGFKKFDRMPEQLAALLSLVLWAGVVVAGRWTGHIN